MNKKSFFIAILPVIVQYYDYHLFGLLAAQISKYFFASGDSVTQLMKTYTVLWIAALAKSFSATILGRIGDVYGRIKTVLVSLLGAAIACFIVAIAPGYDQIGSLAGFILLFSRMTVAALASPMTDGIRIYVFEKIGQDKQCLGNGVVGVFSQFGLLLAHLSAHLSISEVLPAYSWKFAFLFGTVLGIFALFVKINNPSIIDDSTKSEPKYDTYKNKSTLSIIWENKTLFFCSTILTGCIGSSYKFIIIFFGVYSFEMLGLLNQSDMIFISEIAVTLQMIFAIIGGMFADRFGKMLSSNLFGVLTILFALVLINGIAKNQLVLWAYFGINICLPFLGTPALAILKTSIPKVIRYRIFSLSHACGSLLISESTGFICTSMYKYLANNWVVLIYFLITVTFMIISINILNVIYVKRNVQEQSNIKPNLANI